MAVGLIPERAVARNQNAARLAGGYAMALASQHNSAKPQEVQYET